MNFPIRPSFPCLKFPLSAFRFPLSAFPPTPPLPPVQRIRVYRGGAPKPSAKMDLSTEAFGEGGFKSNSKVFKGFQSIPRKKKMLFVMFSQSLHHYRHASAPFALIRLKFLQPFSGLPATPGSTCFFDCPCEPSPASIQNSCPSDIFKTSSTKMSPHFSLMSPL